MPTPEKKSVVVGGNPVMIGTRNVAPNIATTCCPPKAMVRGHESRSSGRTIASGLDGAAVAVQGPGHVVLLGASWEGVDERRAALRGPGDCNAARRTTSHPAGRAKIGELPSRAASSGLASDPRHL